jgi:hypothetical protein
VGLKCRYGWILHDGKTFGTFEFLASSTEVNEKFADLHYKNKMFDQIQYTDICSIWIKGYPEIYIKIKIKREIVPD